MQIIKVIKNVSYEDFINLPDTIQQSIFNNPRETHDLTYISDVPLGSYVSVPYGVREKFGIVIGNTDEIIPDITYKKINKLYDGTFDYTK